MTDTDWRPGFEYLFEDRKINDRASSQRDNLAQAVEAQAERAQKRLELELADAERRELAALSRPQSMVRDAMNTPGCPHRALAQIADDDLAVARQLLADEMEARRE
jgi:regulator of protease activity HflC (stomatin/prohibitin superfamily)